MATAREHMLADTRALFDNPDGPATDEVVDGIPLRAIVKGLETDPAKMDRVFVDRKSLWLFPGDLDPFPPLGAEITFREETYAVELSQQQDFSDRLILVRYTS